MAFSSPSGSTGYSPDSPFTTLYVPSFAKNNLSILPTKWVRLYEIVPTGGSMLSPEWPAPVLNSWPVVVPDLPFVGLKSKTSLSDWPL